MRRRKETFRDLDMIATATRPGLADRVLRPAAVGASTSPRTATRRRPSSRATGSASTCASCRRSRTGTCSSTSPARRTHNVAMREDAVRRGLSISEYGVTTVETGDVFRTEDEDALYAFLGYQPIAPELREDGGELEAARRGELPELVELVGRARRPAHAHALVLGREEHARGDGRRGGRARLRVLRDHRPLALSPRRPPCGAARGDRARARAISEAAHPRRRRGEHPHERRGRRARGGARAARLGRRLRAPGAGEPARPSACSRRWTTRTSTASAT